MHLYSHWNPHPFHLSLLCHTPLSKWWRQILLTILAQVSPCSQRVLLFFYFLWTSNTLDTPSDGLLELGRPSLFQATVHGASRLLLSALHLGLLEHKVALLYTLTNQETKRTFYNYIFSYWFLQNSTYPTYQYLNYWRDCWDIISKIQSIDFFPIDTQIYLYTCSSCLDHVYTHIYWVVRHTLDFHRFDILSFKYLLTTLKIYDE